MKGHWFDSQSAYKRQAIVFPSPSFHSLKENKRERVADTEFISSLNCEIYSYYFLKGRFDKGVTNKSYRMCYLDAL